MERIARLTTKRREKEELEGLRGERKREREREREYQSHRPGMCQSLSYGAPPPFLRPHSLCFSFCSCMCVWQTLQWFCPCLTVIKNLRKLFKSKAVKDLCRNSSQDECRNSHWLRAEERKAKGMRKKKVEDSDKSAQSTILMCAHWCIRMSAS